MTQIVLTESSKGLASSANSHLLSFYPKYSLEWKVDQLAGGAASAMGISVS